MSKRIAFSIICIVLTATSLMAQNTIQITTKEGKVESVLNGRSSEQIDSLIISGEINNTDLLYLSNLPNLRFLDISKAELSREFSKNLLDRALDFFGLGIQGQDGSNNGHFDGEKLNLVGFKSLTELRLGDQVRHLCFYQGFEKLTIPRSCEIEYVPNGVVWIQELMVGYAGNKYLDSETIGVFDKIREKSERPSNISDFKPWMIEVDDDSVPWRGFGYGHCQELDNIKIAVMCLHLPTYSFLGYNNSLESTILPVWIVFDDNRFTVLNYYLDSLWEHIPFFTCYSIAAFANSTFRNFTLPKHIKLIPKYCFAYCNQLTQFDAGNVERIGPFAFMGTALKEITLPETLKEINADAFAGSNLEIIRMKGPAPLVYKYEHDNTARKKYVDNVETDAVFIVPGEFKGTYSVGPWANAIVMEEGAKTEFEISLSKEGELKKYLTDEIKETAQRLTIKGIMNDLEFADLQKCKNLVYLDLSNCFTIKSEYTSYIEYQTDKAIFDIASLKLEEKQKDNEFEYSNGWKSTSSYLSYKNILAQADNELKRHKKTFGEWKPSTSCYLPEDAFDNLHHLSEVLLPKALTDLNTSMKRIKKVTLPPGLERIGPSCFKNSPISSIKFPSSLEFIGERCFQGCQNLERVNLKNTNIKELTFDCFHDSGVKVLKAPKELKSLVNGKNYDRARVALVRGGASLAIPEIYFYTSTPPEGLFGTAGIERIHILRGYKVGWVSKVDLTTTSLIDDIIFDKEDDEDEDQVESNDSVSPSKTEKEGVDSPDNLGASTASVTESRLDSLVNKEHNHPIEIDSTQTVEQSEGEIANQESKEVAYSIEDSQETVTTKVSTPISLPHFVLKASSSVLSFNNVSMYYTVGGGIGLYNAGDTRLGGELGFYLCPGLKSSSLFGVDASFVFRITNIVYPKLNIGYFSYNGGTKAISATQGLCAGAGLTFVLGDHFCLELGAKYYPEISVREVERVLTTPGPVYHFTTTKLVLPASIVPVVSLGWAF